MPIPFFFKGYKNKTIQDKSMPSIYGWKRLKEKYQVKYFWGGLSIYPFAFHISIHHDPHYCFIFHNPDYAQIIPPRYLAVPSSDPLCLFASFLYTAL